MSPFWTRYHETMTVLWNRCEEVGFLQFLGEMAGGVAVGCVAVCFLGCLFWSIPPVRVMVGTMLSTFSTFAILVHRH